MDEAIFPPSPSWFLPNIIAAREDDGVAYGSKNNIVILKSARSIKPEMLIIPNAHDLKVTAVAFSPSSCCKTLQNTLVSCSEDGFVKLWQIDTLTASIGHNAHWEVNGTMGKIVSLDWNRVNPIYVVSAAENNSIVLWDVLSNTTKKFCFHKYLGTTVISCCPFNEKIVAVGGTSGKVLIISLTGSGDILWRLRGHDYNINSFSWCPVPYNVFKKNEICEEFLLASACQNKEIFVWRVGTDGKCEAKLQIPSSPLLKKKNRYYGRKGNSFSFSALLWFEPYKIYISSNFGELIYFDINSYISNTSINKTKSGQKLNEESGFFKLGHFFHTKGVFAIAGSPVKPKVVIYKNSEIKSQLKYKKGFNYEVIKLSESKNDSDLTWETIMPEMLSLVWTAGLDRRLISCEVKSSRFEMVSNYPTMNGFVSCAVVSPHDRYKIAIGAWDGAVRLWNLSDIENIKVFWDKVKDKVNSLAWHPTKDGVLAYGTSEGRVGLIYTNSPTKHSSIFKSNHAHPIYSLSWGPQFNFDVTQLNSEAKFDLYVVGDNTLALYDPSDISADPINLSKLISFPCLKITDVSWKPDYSLMAVGSKSGIVCLVEPFTFEIVQTILTSSEMIRSIAWHPSSTTVDVGLSPFHGYLTWGSTSNDYSIPLFNCTIEEERVIAKQVGVLKGHHGHIISVCWSSHSSGRLVSTSTDHSVQIWDAISRTPLVNFCPSGMPLFSLCSPIDFDFIITGCRNDVLHIWKVSAQTKVSPSPKAKTKKLKTKTPKMVLSEEVTVESDKTIKNKDKNDTENNIVVAEKMEIKKKIKEPKVFSKTWKNSVTDEMERCYLLLKNEERKNIKENYSFLFLDDEQNFLKFLSNEEESLKKSNSFTELGELALWKGNLKEVLEETITRGQLNDFLVSLAPCVGPKFWVSACTSYSKTLEEKKMYRKAASYLIVCNKFYEAIELLVHHDLYAEALCIARRRLSDNDPVIPSIIEGYAQWLYKDGSFLKACECYIYLENYLEVAKICRKKNNADYLSLAALAAKKCGSNLEELEAFNALLKSFETDNFELARRICDDHDNLMYLRLLYCVYHTIHQLENGELALKKDLLLHIRKSFNADNVVFPSSLPKHYHNYSSYKNKRQMYSVVAEELSFAICSQEMETVITHLVKALSTCCRYVRNSSSEAEPLYELCTWLSPGGFLNGNDFFSYANDQTSPKTKSMRAFLCTAIVRYLNDGQKTEDLLKYLDVLDQLKEDLLDVDNYKYVKNFIDVKICENRALNNKNQLFKMKLKNEHKSANHLNNTESIENTENSNLINSKKDEDDRKENGFSESDIQENTSLENHKSSENVEENPNNNSTDVLEDEVAKNLETLSVECEDIEVESEISLESMIQEDLELLSALKEEIENFELARVSSPNPVPVFFMLRTLCEGISDNEKVKSFQNDIETKWKELNVTD